MTSKTQLVSAMQITGITRFKHDAEPLRYVRIPVPDPGPGQLLIMVRACAVCHIELDEVEEAPLLCAGAVGHRALKLCKHEKF